MGRKLNFIVLAVLVIISLSFASNYPELSSNIDKGDTAWMLVAITPAAGFVNIGQSMFIGFAASIVSNWAIHFQNKSDIDDTLDVFPSHGIGGITGMLLTAVFASGVGLIYGETSTFMYHLLALLITGLLAFFGSLALYKFVDVLLTMRVRPDQEERGLDISQHGEQA